MPVPSLQSLSYMCVCVCPMFRGNFDHADRMFGSVPLCWRHASSGGLADVKELIPEWFTTPEMFLNINRFEMGNTQKQHSLNHVTLPKWAHNDPHVWTRLETKPLQTAYNVFFAVIYTASSKGLGIGSCVGEFASLDRPYLRIQATRGSSCPGTECILSSGMFGAF